MQKYKKIHVEKTNSDVFMYKSFIVCKLKKNQDDLKNISLKQGEIKQVKFEISEKSLLLYDLK